MIGARLAPLVLESATHLTMVSRGHLLSSLLPRYGIGPEEIYRVKPAGVRLHDSCENRGQLERSGTTNVMEDVSSDDLADLVLLAMGAGEWLTVTGELLSSTCGVLCQRCEDIAGLATVSISSGVHEAFRDVVQSMTVGDVDSRKGWADGLLIGGRLSFVCWVSESSIPNRRANAETKWLRVRPLPPLWRLRHLSISPGHTEATAGIANALCRESGVTRCRAYNGGSSPARGGECAWDY